MKSLFVLTILFSLNLFAGGRDEAYQGICRKMDFESSKNSCMKKLKDYTYFNEGAIAVCGTLSFESEMMSCVSAIGDKLYERYEIANCADQGFDSEKLKCLRESGQKVGPGGPCPPTVEVLGLLYRAQDFIRAGRYHEADANLTSAILALRSCAKSP